MRITVSGAPGSPHYAVSKAIADRLGHEHLAIKDIISTDYVNNTIDYHMLNPHRSAVLNNKLNCRLIEILHSKKDYVVDALLSSEFSKNAVSIFLDSIYTSMPVFALKHKADYDYEVCLCRNFMRYEYTDYRNYDIYINTTGMTVDCVVDVILNSLYSGNRGLYSKVDYLLPVSLDAPSPSNEDLFGLFSQGFLLVSNDILNRKEVLRSGSVVYMNPDLAPKGVEYAIPNPLTYEDWFRLVKPADTNILVKLMFHQYCVDKGVITESDKRAEFVQLTLNGSLLHTLTGLGYLK